MRKILYSTLLATSVIMSSGVVKAEDNAGLASAPGFAIPALGLVSGPAIAYGNIGYGAYMIAYCQYHMKKDEKGNVIYQHPDCNDNKPVFVGSTTKNPYVPVGVTCTKDAKRGWVCPK